MQHTFRSATLVAFALLAAPTQAADLWRNSANTMAAAAQRNAETTALVTHQGQIEVGFSPDEGAEKLVIKVIDGARQEIRLMAYSFTSAPVVDALLRAKKRGVDVRVVADQQHNLSSTNNKAIHALSTLALAGINVRIVSEWAAQHSKAIITDRRNVETGSFNYSAAAATRNSENVIVVWNNPDLANIYLQHWESRFARGKDFNPRY